MKIYGKTLFALAVAVLLASAATAVEEDKVVATVGPEKITESQLTIALAALPPQQRAYYGNPEGRKALLDELISFHLFALSGRDQNIQDTEEFKTAMKDYENQVLANLAAKRAIDSVAVEVQDSEVEQYYQEHEAAFRTPAAIRARHILIEVAKDASAKDVRTARNKAVSLIRDIRTNKISFEDAAKENSACPSNSRGGDLGFFSKGQMVPEFEEAAFALEKGSMTREPVRSDYGFHIIEVTDTRPEVSRSLDEVREDIRTQMTMEARSEAYSKIVAELKERYKVTETLSAEAEDQ